MRERIAELLWIKYSRGFHSNESYFAAAEDILALPSGMEAGEITRDLSIGMIVNAVITNDLWRDGAGYFLYSTGERVRVKLPVQTS